MVKDELNEVKETILSGYWVMSVYRTIFYFRIFLYVFILLGAMGTVYFYYLLENIELGIIIAFVSLILLHILIKLIYSLLMILLRNSINLNEVRLYLTKIHE